MKKFIENDTANTMYVMGKMIPPGEGREIDVPDVQEPEQAEAADPDALFRELLAGNVKHIAAQLADQSDATLERLAALEGESKTPRKSLLQAIEAEKLSRANDALDRDRAVHEATQELAAAEKAVKDNADPGQAEALEQRLMAAQAVAAELGLVLRKD